MTPRTFVRFLAFKTTALVLGLYAQTTGDFRLNARKADAASVSINWDATLNPSLEESETLDAPINWQSFGQAPVLNGANASVTVQAASHTRFFRLRTSVSTPLGRILETSPANGETAVSVTRETIFRLDRPLGASISISPTQLFAEGAGRRLLAHTEISTDRRTVSLFYLEPLPGSARVRVTFRGDTLTDGGGTSFDLDGNGQPGGDAVVEFETGSLTPVAQTVVVGRVFASESAPGPGGQTNSINKPLRGVTITVDGAEETLRAVTDEFGNFRLEPAPSGTFFVHIDGRTSPESVWPNGPYYPYVGKSWTAVAGRDNNLAGGSGEIYLPFVASGTLQPVSAQQDTVVMFPASVLQKNPELEGVQIDVPANSLFSDNGVRGGRVGIAPVPADRLPSPLPPGLSFPLVITIQTDGPSNFDRPVPVRFPNLPDPVTGEKLPPGAKSALWSFNHDTGEWQVVGPMTVSADGRFVVSDPGTGVLQPGWHGTRPGTPARGPRPTIPDLCGQSGDYAFNESACNARSLKNVAGLIKDAADLTSSLSTPGAKDALEFLKKLKETGNDARKQSELCHACCLIINGSDFGCPGNLFSFGTQSVSAQTSDPIKALARMIVNLASLAEQHAALLEAQVNLLGSLADPQQLPADKRAQFDALQAQILGLYGQGDPAAFLQAAMTQVGAMIPALPPSEDLFTDEPAFFRIRDLLNGSEQRGVTGTGGAIDNLILQPSRVYQLERYFARSHLFGSVIFRSGPNGRNTTIPPGYVLPDNGVDSDGDQLSDQAEAVVGTDPQSADTDGDGLLDGAEVQDGLDPLGGLIAQTGVISSVPLAGTAIDICALNNMAIVAEGETGISVLNIFSGLNPSLIAQVDTPGQALRVSCSRNLIAVADGSQGLAVIDISNPARARIVRQVDLGSRAESVAASAGIAYVGLSSGKIAAVDLGSGSILETVDAGGFPHDLTIAGDNLYAITQSELLVWSLAPDFLQLLGRIPHNRYFAEGITGRKRLFVGGGYAYATVYPGYDVYDVRNPGNLRHVGLSRDGGPNSFKQIVLNGSGLGIAAVGVNPRDDGTHDVYLYDVTDPANTSNFQGALLTPGVARALSLYNGLAYVADGESGLQVINYLPYDTKKTAPSLTLLSSGVEGLIEGGKAFRLSAEVSDDVQVRNVEFYVDGALAAVDGNYPFEFRFVTPQATPAKTNLTVRARATDTGGNGVWSPELVFQLVEDATPPRLRKLSPRDGAISGNVNGVALFFSEPIATETLSSQNIRITYAGPDGLFGTADDAVISPTSVQFRPDVLGAFLDFAPGLAPGAYRGEITAGVTDRAGLHLANPGGWGFRVFSLSGDRDGDCLPDSLEILLGLDPDNPDTDGNGIPDGEEDFDKDGLSNCGEVLLGYDPGNPDSDGNGIPDGLEDFDKDGIPDGEEVIPGTDGFITDPLLSDTDGDGIPDNLEIALGLDPTNPADGQADVVLDSRSVTVNGKVRLHSLVLTNGAVLTHPAAGRNGLAGLELTVSNLVIDAKSRIDVGGRGYAGGLTTENPSQAGRTLNNVDGSARRNGGSYGGLGGNGTAEPASAPAYGSYSSPDALGGGGGSDSGAAGNGGGLVRIFATNIVLEGQIVANGASGSFYAGGGAGGGILLNTTTLSGGGSLAADGGDGGQQSGGGGGGRIAIIASQTSATLEMHAFGGGGREQGGPGTVFTRFGSQAGEILIRGTGRETTLPTFAGGEKITIESATVSGNVIQAAQLDLVSGATLTHAPATLSEESRLVLNVDRIFVDTNSSINVAGRGYLGGRTAGNGDQRGRTLGNAPGSTRRNGGSYGGLGGTGTAEPTVAATYGDYHSPNELGGGGGSDSGASGSGGGLIQIQATQLIVEGSIIADGFGGSFYGGGGSGGGIRLIVDSLVGGGAIHADGGAGGQESGGGGGGRIALTANTISDNLSLHAFGGTGSVKGGSGTLYFKRGNLASVLQINGSGRETPLPAIASGEQLIINGARVSAQQISTAELTLLNGAVLTHPSPSGTATTGLEIDVAKLLVETNSSIDISSRGYPGARTPGNSSNVGVTFGALVGSDRRGGGSYGGLGGLGSASSGVNAVYGDFHDPNELGSGGGSDSDRAGSGGGLIRISAQEAMINGSILANGGAGTFYGGGGSGGGIKISAGSLSGVGTIQANGGAGGQESGGGGGGKIALLLTQAPTGNLATADGVQTFGGAGYSHAAPGLIYIKIGNNSGQFIVRGTGRETPLPENTASDRILLDQAVLSARNLAALELRLQSGATLTHPGATVQSAERLEINAGILSIDSTSQINADARGYLGARSGGNVSNNGRTYKNVEGSVRRAGGSYGGMGGIGSAEPFPNLVYGAWADPNEPGSGGGSDSNFAGNGGGLIRIVTSDLQLNGRISAMGGSGSFYGGGGSGGGIKITTTRLSGGGSIRADGGLGYQESGSGGGGRIALFYGENAGFDLTKISATGGPSGARQGSPGTVFVHGPASVVGELIIDAKGTNLPSIPTPIVSLTGGPSSSLTANSLTDTNADFIPGALIGLKLKPRASDARTFTVIDNDAQKIFTRPADGSLLQAALAGDPYTTENPVDRMILRSGAWAEVYDGDASRTDRTGVLRAGSLALESSSVLTHSPASSVAEYGLDLRIDQSTRVDDTSRIDLDARGYLGALHPENSGQAGRTIGNASGSAARTGGSYGGLGGVGSAGAEANGLYGDLRNPFESGSGGGSDSGAAGSGGGRVRLQTGNLILDGVITAGGGNGGFYAAGGSGGAINIQTGDVSGMGSIRANGGQGGNQSGGGGGGRIAILYDSASGESVNNVAALGGTGFNTGGAGTIYRRAGAAVGQLLIRGIGRETFLPEGDFREDIVIDAAALSVRNLTARNLTLTNGATLTHLRATTNAEPRLQLSLTNLTIDASSRIDVTGRGYLGGLQGGNNAQEGRTLGNALGSTRRNGGSYGGLGGLGSVGGALAPIYGSANDPNELGSGGGSDSGAAGSGGGLARIFAGSVTLDGAIAANGASGGFYAGGGSGGGILLQASILKGGGTIQANGGNGGNESGGGGGGRVKLTVTDRTGFNDANIRTEGGSGRNSGQPGTIVY